MINKIEMEAIESRVIHGNATNADCENLIGYIKASAILDDEDTENEIADAVTSSIESLIDEVSSVVRDAVEDSISQEAIIRRIERSIVKLKE